MRLDNEIHARVLSRGKRGADPKGHASMHMHPRDSAMRNGEIASSMHGNHVVVMYDWCGVVHIAICCVAPLSNPQLPHLVGTVSPIGAVYVVLRPATLAYRERERRERERGRKRIPAAFYNGG